MTGSVLIVAAPASGHGKTLVTAGLALALQRQGKTVVLFKMGPDYLDPMFIKQATGLEVRQLDYWMLSEAEIAAELSRAVNSADHVLIEGVMGLFDGQHSVAELAKAYQIPVMIVADASAMAQTFGALMQGLADYDADVNVAAVLANRVGSEGHGQMITESVRAPLKYLGWVQRDESLVVPERHLGIHTEARQLCQDTANAMADRLTDMLPDLPWQPLELDHAPVDCPFRNAPPWNGYRIAIARDQAFSFLYPANLDFLRRAGAELLFFSPLNNEPVPDCDALYLPGGYPELHVTRLGQASATMATVRDHINADKPCLAECGGMLFLQHTLTKDNDTVEMAGIFAGQVVFGARLAGLGYQALPDTPLRGHTFHYGRVEHVTPTAHASNKNGAEGEAIYRTGKTQASFVHWYFASDPWRIVRWFNGEFDIVAEKSSL